MATPPKHSPRCTCPACCLLRRQRNRDKDWKTPGGWQRQAVAREAMKSGTPSPEMNPTRPDPNQSLTMPTYRQINP